MIRKARPNKHKSNLAARRKPAAKKLGRKWLILAQPGKEGELLRRIKDSSAVQYTLRGSTHTFQVYYDDSLGIDGQTRADAVLERCEGDYMQLNYYFWQTVLWYLPLQIYIDAGLQGAWHHLDTPQIHVGCYEGYSSSAQPYFNKVVNSLNVAEVSELFMYDMNHLWYPGFSHGEGLSRVLAANAYPDAQQMFISGQDWLNSARPDWIINTEQTDEDSVSYGCSVLFLNYLRFQLDFTWEAIVRAGAATLAETYSKLTGQTDAFAPFAWLLGQQFPIGKTWTIGDNPFPIRQEFHICGITQGSVFYTYKPVGGVWQPFVSMFPGQNNFAAADCAGIVNGVQFCAISSDGGIWHQSGNVVTNVKNYAGDPGLFKTVACTGINGELQICGITADGVMWHTVRHIDGSWTQFAKVPWSTLVSQSPPAPFVGVSCSGNIFGGLYVCAVTGDGRMWQTFQDPQSPPGQGPWEWYSEITASGAGNPGQFIGVSCATMRYDEANGSFTSLLEVCGVTTDGQMWHTIQDTSTANWGNFLTFENVKAKAGDPGNFRAVSCTVVNNELQVCGATDDGKFWNTIRYADGSWAAFADPTVSSGSPGQVSAVGSGRLKSAPP